jgi:hypothetical protein
MPFTRPFSVDILLSATLDGSGTITASLTMDLTMSAKLDGAGGLVGDFIRELFIAAELDGIGTMDVQMIRERLMTAAMNGEGSLQGDLSRYRVESITVTGPFAPGDKMVIDAGKLRTTKNGLPAAYSGDFFDLHPGQNTMTYTDQASGRAVQIRITHRDKYLY